MEELKTLNQILAEILSQLRGAATNLNQIARKMNTDGFMPREDILYYLLSLIHISQSDCRRDYSQGIDLCLNASSKRIRSA